MKKWILLAAVLLGCIPVGAQQVAEVTVYPSRENGPVKMMNAANNFASAGPKAKELGVPYAKELACPYSRIHDAERVPHGSGIVDINAIFPDFAKDPTKPENYNFHHSDRYMKSVMATGTKPLYRLGQSAESGAGKIGPVPPADFKKWAVICEHVVRHYNEGWANGFHYGIEYWEIWNEANIKSFWTGTQEQYFELYTVTAKHLKKCFPELKIGGPAVAGGDIQWSEAFLQHIRAKEAPLDFFSYHKYTTDPSILVQINRDMRALLYKYGYDGLEMQLGEWNYVTGWSTPEVNYSNKVRRTELGGAFAAAVMCALQKERVDKLFFYDLREYTRYNNAYDRYSATPWPAYYALYAWAQLRKLGTSVDVSCPAPDIYTCAAKAPDGRTGLLVVRYNNDGNVVMPATVQVSVEGYDLSDAICFMTDDSFLFSGLPVSPKDGQLTFDMQPNSFAYITFSR